jgi:hypothetical protein
MEKQLQLTRWKGRQTTHGGVTHCLPIPLRIWSEWLREAVYLWGKQTTTYYKYADRRYADFDA